MRRLVGNYVPISPTLSREEVYRRIPEIFKHIFDALICYATNEGGVPDLKTIQVICKIEEDREHPDAYGTCGVKMEVVFTEEGVNEQQTSSESGSGED